SWAAPPAAPSALANDQSAGSAVDGSDRALPRTRPRPGCRQQCGWHRPSSPATEGERSAAERMLRGRFSGCFVGCGKISPAYDAMGLLRRAKPEQAKKSRCRVQSEYIGATKENV